MAPNFTAQTLQQQFPKGIFKSYTKGDLICDTHREVQNFRWLVEGSMDYFISLGNLENEILVCQISEPWSSLGSSGLNPPGRYTYKAVVSSENALFFEVPIKAVKHYVLEDAKNVLLQQIASKLYNQLRVALIKQTELLQPVRFKPLEDDREFFMSPNEDELEIIKTMRCSPFLDQFTEEQLGKMARITERREYEPYEVLYVQDTLTNGLYILIDGEVCIKRIEGHIEIQQRSITDPGFIFGWSCFLDKKDICNALTTHKTAVYFVPYCELSKLFRSEREFEEHFYRRLIWLMTNQMNAALLRYAGLLGKHNLQAVFQLIENNKSRLPLSSDLHQVTHLLKNTNTKKIAYKSLKYLVQGGTSLERHIASLSLELLKDDQEELKFIKGLQHIYKSVANSPIQEASQIRKECAKATKKLFEQLNFHIEGWENLPDSGGHIFIYNHLVNDLAYTLNNNFQITLDSHFISALILDEKYGEPGIRTVRMGRGQEYGHQNYYKKLGHINVYTKESEQTSKADQNESRSVFYQQAEHYLNEGYNLIISPEGTSYRTENSPGPFKLGSFKLAWKMEKEPYIVPLVLVNFDHRIKDNLYYCKIYPPFKLSDTLNSNSVEGLLAFVQEYEKTYAHYVNSARQTVEELAKNPLTMEKMEEPPEIWGNEIKRLKQRVTQLQSQEDLVVFYGSSSIRLWVNLKKDLKPLQTLNLGFGGSSFAWCIHYFSEIFDGVRPQKIVLYAGENDLSDGKTPQEVLADCKELIGLVHEKYPKVELALISLKPSVEREGLIPQIMETNLLLSKYIIGELNAQFINIFARMITSDNRPRPELYLSDGLHLNKAGYAIWSNVIKEALTAYEEV